MLLRDSSDLCTDQMYTNDPAPHTINCLTAHGHTIADFEGYQLWYFTQTFYNSIYDTFYWIPTTYSLINVQHQCFTRKGMPPEGCGQMQFETNLPGVSYYHKDDKSEIIYEPAWKTPLSTCEPSINFIRPCKPPIFVQVTTGNVNMYLTPYELDTLVLYQPSLKRIIVPSAPPLSLDQITAIRTRSFNFVYPFLQPFNAIISNGRLAPNWLTHYKEKAFAQRLISKWEDNVADCKPFQMARMPYTCYRNLTVIDSVVSYVTTEDDYIERCTSYVPYIESHTAAIPKWLKNIYLALLDETSAIFKQTIYILYHIIVPIFSTIDEHFNVVLNIIQYILIQTYMRDTRYTTILYLIVKIYPILLTRMPISSRYDN